MNRITLHHIDGYTWTYESLEDAYNQLGYDFIERKVGFQFNYCSSEKDFFDYRTIVNLVPLHANFIMRDDSGKEITYKDFDKFFERDCKIRMNMFNNKAVMRGIGPIPGTRKRSGRYKIIKRPHSMNEKKNVSKCLTEAFDNNVYIKLRSKRNIVNLPDAYDDINRADVDDRSWKANKRNKHQWK